MEVYGRWMELGGDGWGLGGVGGALDMSAGVGRGVTGRQSGHAVERKTMTLGLETQIWGWPAI